MRIIESVLGVGGLVYLSCFSLPCSGSELDDLFAKLSFSQDFSSAEERITTYFGQGSSTLDWRLRTLDRAKLNGLPTTSLAAILYRTRLFFYRFDTFDFDSEGIDSTKWKAAFALVEARHHLDAAGKSGWFAPPNLRKLFQSTSQLADWMQYHRAPVHPELMRILTKSFEPFLEAESHPSQVDSVAPFFLDASERVLALLKSQPWELGESDEGPRDDIEEWAKVVFGILRKLERYLTLVSRIRPEAEHVADLGAALVEILRGDVFGAEGDWRTDEGLEELFQDSPVFNPDPAVAGVMNRLKQLNRTDSFSRYLSDGPVRPALRAGALGGFFSLAASHSLGPAGGVGALALGLLPAGFVFAKQIRDRIRYGETEILTRLIAIASVFDRLREENIFMTSKIGRELVKVLKTRLHLPSDASEPVVAQFFEVIRSALDWIESAPDSELGDRTSRRRIDNLLILQLRELAVDSRPGLLAQKNEWIRKLEEISGPPRMGEDFSRSGGGQSSDSADDPGDNSLTIRPLDLNSAETMILEIGPADDFDRRSLNLFVSPDKYRYLISLSHEQRRKMKDHLFDASGIWLSNSKSPNFFRYRHLPSLVDFSIAEGEGLEIWIHPERRDGHVIAAYAPSGASIQVSARELQRKFRQVVERSSLTGAVQYGMFGLCRHALYRTGITH